MTVTTWLLLILAVLTGLGCVAFLFPAEWSVSHPYEANPFTDVGDHIGRREWPDSDDGPTRRLQDGPLRWPQG